MKASTAKAIKALLRTDGTVTTLERLAVVGALCVRSEDAEALDLAGDVSIAAASEYLSMSRTTLWRMCQRGDIAATRRGKKYYIAGDEVARLKEEAVA